MRNGFFERRPREAHFHFGIAQPLGGAMTAKWAALELPIGGGKAVIALPRPLAGAEREGLLERYGSLIESLRGAFGTGEDLGTTPADMAVIGCPVGMR